MKNDTDSKPEKMMTDVSILYNGSWNTEEMTNTRKVIEISDSVFTEEKAAVLSHLVICVYLCWVAG